MKSINLLLTAAMVGLSACSGSMPRWCANAPKKGGSSEIMACGTAVSQNSQVALDRARANARAQIAQRINVNVEQVTSQFINEVGQGESSDLYQEFTDALDLSVNQTLRGSQEVKMKLLERGDAFEAFMIVSAPITQIDAAIESQLATNPELLNSFLTSETRAQLGSILIGGND